MGQSVINVLSVGIVYFVLCSEALAQNSSVELLCRAKAKEIAAETYKGCVTELKQAQIEKIRNDYQAKLKDLKNYYDGELRRVNGKTPQSKSAALTNGETPALSATMAPKAKSFPQQNNVSNIRKNPQTGARSMTKSLPTKTTGVNEYLSSSTGSSPLIQRENTNETAVIQSSEAPVSIELRPESGARIPKGNPDFDDETVENPIVE